MKELLLLIVPTGRLGGSFDSWSMSSWLVMAARGLFCYNYDSVVIENIFYGSPPFVTLVIAVFDSHFRIIGVLLEQVL